MIHYAVKVRAYGYTRWIALYNRSYQWERMCDKPTKGAYDPRMLLHTQEEALWFAWKAAAYNKRRYGADVRVVRIATRKCCKGHK